jgi:hypothetical protein
MLLNTGSTPLDGITRLIVLPHGPLYAFPLDGKGIAPENDTERGA